MINLPEARQGQLAICQQFKQSDQRSWTDQDAVREGIVQEDVEGLEWTRIGEAP